MLLLRATVVYMVTVHFNGFVFFRYVFLFSCVFDYVTPFEHNLSSANDEWFQLLLVIFLTNYKKLVEPITWLLIRTCDNRPSNIRFFSSFRHSLGREKTDFSKCELLWFLSKVIDRVVECVYTWKTRIMMCVVSQFVYWTTTKRRHNPFISTRVRVICVYNFKLKSHWLSKNRECAYMVEFL